MTPLPACRHASESALASFRRDDMKDKQLRRVILCGAAFAGLVLMLGQRREDTTTDRPATPPTAQYVDFAEKLEKTRAQYHRSLAASWIAAAAGSAMLLVGATFMFAPTRDVGLVLTPTGISDSDYIAVVLGLAALVAAITIAVVATGVQDDSTHALSQAFWTDTAAGVASSAAVAGLAVALTRVPSTDRRGEALLTIALLGIAAMAVSLAAAVSSWAGRSLLESRRLRVQLNLIERELLRYRGLGEVSRRRMLLHYLYFVCCAAIGTVLATLTAVDLQEHFALDVTWRLVIGVPVLAVPVAFLTWLFTRQVLLAWQDSYNPSRSDRWTNWILIVLLALSVTIASLNFLGSPVGVLSVMMVTSGGIIVPMLVLVVARVFGRGPGVFALRIVRRAALKTRDETIVRLDTLR